MNVSQMNPPNFFCRLKNKTWFNTRSQRRSNILPMLAYKGTPRHSNTRSAQRAREKKKWSGILLRLAMACKLGVNTLPGDIRQASAQRDAAPATFLRRLQSMNVAKKLAMPRNAGISVESPIRLATSFGRQDFTHVVTQADDNFSPQRPL